MRFHLLGRGVPHLLALCLFCWVSGLCADLGAQPDSRDRTLQQAVTALEKGDYEKARRLLKRAGRMHPEDPRVDYYLGYAHEKLGECDQAASHYRAAAEAGERWERLRGTARAALSGLDERCRRPATEGGDDPTERQPLRRGRFGWKLLGWSTLTLGALTALSIPLKVTIERDALAQSKPYFRERYGCEVDYGEVSGESCDEGALMDDSLFDAYQDRVEQSRQTTTYLLLASGGLAAIGVTTLVILAATRGGPTVGLLMDGTSIRATLRWAF